MNDRLATQAAAAFDADKFKQTTRAQWESAADAWDRWGGLLGQWLGPATEAMLDMAAVGPGARVLDVAAGAGEQTLAAARRAGPRGRVLATDISPAILRHARARAGKAGLANVETLELDGERHDTLAQGSFDAAISRVGLIYFPDQQRALAGIRHALRDGGRFAAVVDSPVRLPAAADCVRFERESFGALHQMMAAMSEAERADTWAEIERELGRFQGAEGFSGPCEMLVGAGTR